MYHCASALCHQYVLHYCAPALIHIWWLTCAAVLSLMFVLDVAALCACRRSAFSQTCVLLLPVPCRGWTCSLRLTASCLPPCRPEMVTPFSPQPSGDLIGAAIMAGSGVVPVVPRKATMREGVFTGLNSLMAPRSTSPHRHSSTGGAITPAVEHKIETLSGSPCCRGGGLGQPHC